MNAKYFLHGNRKFLHYHLCYWGTCLGLMHTNSLSHLSCYLEIIPQDWWLSLFPPDIISYAWFKHLQKHCDYNNQVKHVTLNKAYNYANFRLQKIDIINKFTFETCLYLIYYVYILKRINLLVFLKNNKNYFRF